MKILCSIAVSFILATSLHAQDGFTYRGVQGTIDVFRTDGRPWSNTATDIEGSPFYNDDWRLADVILSSNKHVDHIKVRLNCNSQELHFLDNQNTEMAVSGGIVRGFIFVDPAKGRDSVLTEFRNGYPPVDHHRSNTFYELVSAGKLQLLRTMDKPVSTEKHEMTGDIKKMYVSYEDYYLYDGKEMKRLKKDKSFIDSQLADKAAPVADFVSRNHLRYKTVDDIKKILDYYNTLP